MDAPVSGHDQGPVAVAVCLDIRVPHTNRIVRIPCPPEAVQKCSTIRNVLDLTADEKGGHSALQIITIPDFVNIDAPSVRKVFSVLNCLHCNAMPTATSGASEWITWVLRFAQFPTHTQLRESDVEQGILRLYRAYCAADYLGCEELRRVLEGALNGIYLVVKMPVEDFRHFLMNNAKSRLIFDESLYCGVMIVRKKLEKFFMVTLPRTNELVKVL
ncbi:uncharacterized protein LOC129596168 [Paramacrobiotus metropolitanus]|uniref:uncharacterized protein LOC129596168 n=1 Tax=Paramacrobiotus metropolitanus TaxID=2943436 RepID=UPI0024464673|nr:uncharacterized protein LOC129596168 [Paramacrobiotus metropolitanus]